MLSQNRTDWSVETHITNTLFIDLPIALVFLLYPDIFYKSFVGNRNQPRVRGGNESSHAKSRPETNQATKTDGSRAVQPEEGKVTSRTTCIKPRYGSVTGFLTLTSSVLVCLAPNEAFLRSCWSLTQTHRGCSRFSRSYSH